MKDKLRMAEWLLISLVLVVAIYEIKPELLGVSLYKLSLITTAAWVGYWIDRTAFPYARPDELTLTDIERASSLLRRAIIIGAAMLAASLGA